MNTITHVTHEQPVRVDGSLKDSLHLEETGSFFGRTCKVMKAAFHDARIATYEKISALSRKIFETLTSPDFLVPCIMIAMGIGILVLSTNAVSAIFQVSKGEAFHYVSVSIQILIASWGIVEAFKRVLSRA